jgi:hypothetical protein
MQRLIAVFSMMALTASGVAASTVRETRMSSVPVSSQLPADLVSPEGKTRWHLEDVASGPAATVSIDAASAGYVTGDLTTSGADAERWLFPDHDPAQLKMGARTFLDFDETRDGRTERVHADIATVGIGWLHVPAGPYEAVLQRVLLFHARTGERVLIHRWIGTREGVLAEITGPVAADGRTRSGVDRIEVAQTVLSAATLKVYSDQLYRGTYDGIKYGYDARGAATNPLPVSSLVPDSGINNICDLVNLNTWNFSGISSGQETATTHTPINAAETCNTGRCGYAGVPPAGGLEPAFLERLDRNLTGTLRKDNQVVQKETTAAGVTFWLRAGTQNENVAGAFGSGETRFCFTDEVNKPKNEVPVWQMPHNDAGGWYTTAGDTWTSVPIGAACQESFSSGFSGGTCGTGGTTVYSKGCSSGGQTFSGSQFNKVVKGGVVVLASGHTLNAVVIRNTTEYCNYLTSGCGFLVNTVRTIVYFWQAPYVGSVALLRGPQQQNFAAGETGETPCTNFTTVEFTDISYGLFPPVSITAGTATDTTVQLSWNPGNDTHRLNGYKIYWDTDSGSGSDYAFNSVANAGQVVFAGTSATISGLTPGTTYYFTVTSLSDFTDPSSGVLSHYESIRYPTTVSGDPSFSYPIEVAKATTGGACVPTQEVTGLTVNKANPNVHVCWTPTSDACATGYDILASDDATNDAGWTVAGQVGLTSCWDGNPSQKFLLVRLHGPGGSGPWGHYSH